MGLNITRRNDPRTALRLYGGPSWPPPVRNPQKLKAAIFVLAVMKAHVLALNTAPVLRLNKADVLALNKAMPSVHSQHKGGGFRPQAQK